MVPKIALQLAKVIWGKKRFSAARARVRRRGQQDNLENELSVLQGIPFLRSLFVVLEDRVQHKESDHFGAHVNDEGPTVPFPREVRDEGAWAAAASTDNLV
jgi:hypothetical protein